MRKWSAATSSTAPAASMRRSARMRRCSPISCAACWKTAPTPRSSTASPTRAWRSTSWSPIRSRSRRRSSRVGAPHEKIALPRDLYGAQRLNSRGLDITNERRLAELADGLEASARMPRRAFPPGAGKDDKGEAVRNPADHADIVGFTRHARSDEVAAASPRPRRPRRHGRRRRRTSGPRSCAAPRTRSRR